MGTKSVVGRLSVLAAGLAVALSVGAADFIWVGGAEGAWNTLANWELASGEAATAVPGGGDFVDFTNTVSLTGGVAIESGTLSITNSSTDCKAIHFQGVISGAGGIYKRSAAGLHLHAANTFSGGIIAYGTKYDTEGRLIYCDQGNATEKASKVKASSGEVVIYNPQALGAGVTSIDNDQGTRGIYGGSRLLISNVFNNAKVTITNDIWLYSDRCNEGDYTGSFFTQSDVEFTGFVKSSGRVRLIVKNNATVTFNAFYCSSWLNTCSGNGESKLVFKGPWSGANRCTYAPGLDAEIHEPLFVGDLRNSGLTNVRCDEPFSNQVLTITHNSGSVEWNGHRQTFGYLKSCNTGYSHWKNSSAAPARIAFTYVESDINWRADMTGAFDFHWNMANKTFAFSNTVKKMTGSVTVSNGTVCIAKQSGLNGMSRLAVRNQGAFRLEAAATGVCFFENIELDEGRKLTIETGKTLYARTLTVGETVWTNGVYTADNEGAAIVTGAGTLQVGNLPNVWLTAGTGSWDDPANWSLGVVPAAGDNVTIGGAASVSLTEPTPRLASLTLGGGSEISELVLTNWNTCVQADTMTIADKGRLTVFGSFKTETNAPAARVWVKCGDLTVAEGGTIDVDRRGWAVNFGPGRPGNQYKGSSHLGLGGWGIYNGGSYTNRVYDCPYAPELPGSGGYNYADAFGGGAVRIEATGDVRVNGTITANGGGTKYSENATMTAEDVAGSGGAIWITCRTFGGAGQLLAEGGKGGNPRSPSYYVVGGSSCGGRPGGGGGIKIDYDKTAQAGVSVEGMKISVEGGIYGYVKYPDSILTFANQDKYRTEAEAGTLNFSDDQLVRALLGKGLNGRIVGITNYTHVGNLDYVYGHARFAETGATVRIEGNLTVTGCWSRLEVGGYGKRIYATRPYVQAGNTPVSLTVTGDFTLDDGAAFAVYAAATNRTDAWGATVKVNGAFTVGTGAIVYPVCDFVNTGAPRFEVGSFSLAEGAMVDADHRGGSGGWNSGDYASTWGGSYPQVTKGCGVGRGNNGGSAGHGGAGAVAWQSGKYSSDVYAGLACDDPYRPVLPGAGGGSSAFGEGGDGGGIFHLISTGPVVVNGVITACGSTSACFNGGNMGKFGSGAGGTIFLSGSTFAGGASARLVARGGDTWRINYTSGGKTYSDPNIAPTGAGGCVAVWTGSDWEPGLPYSSWRITKSATGAVAEQTFAGTCDVAGGTNCYYQMTYDPSTEDSKTRGGAGTVWFCHLVPKQPTLMLIR